MSEAAKIRATEILDAINDDGEDNAELSAMQEVAVLDDASAAKVVQQLKDAEDQYDKMASWYDRQKQKLKDIRDRTRIWAEVCLRPYFEMVPTTGKKIRSYDMPGSTLKMSSQDPKYEVNDAELVPWLEKSGLGEFVEVKKTARWGDLKETLKDEKKKIRTVEMEDGTLRVITKDGEIIPGITAVPQEDKFSIKFK